MSVGNQNLQDKNRVKTVGALALTSQVAGANPLQQSPIQVGEWQDTVAMMCQDPTGAVGAKVLNRGVIPSSRLAFSVNPSNGNTIGIGSTTIQFVTALGAAQANAQVVIGGTAALTLANLIAYINGTFTSAQAVESTTPPTFTVFADAPTATQLRIRYAASLIANVYTPTRGGTPWPGVSASLALAVTITSGATAWIGANLNETGKKMTDAYESYGFATVSAADITAGFKFIELPFTPAGFSVDCYSSAGVKRAYSDVTAISGNAIQITLGGGASPNIQANDVLSFWASS
jgi:hypothetical protein